MPAAFLSPHSVSISVGIVRHTGGRSTTRVPFCLLSVVAAVVRWYTGTYVFLCFFRYFCITIVIAVGAVVQCIKPQQAFALMSTCRHFYMKLTFSKGFPVCTLERRCMHNGLGRKTSNFRNRKERDEETAFLRADGGCLYFFCMADSRRRWRDLALLL